MDKKEKAIREAPFAMRIVQRKNGKAAVIYRRRMNEEGADRFQRVGTVGPLAFMAATALLREAVTHSRAAQNGNGNGNKAADQILITGGYLPLDPDWGARVACYTVIAAGLRDAERLIKAANHLQHADPTEAAWWMGLLSRPERIRAVRALRILTEAVE
jgi:hypothetical protein